MNTPRRIDPNTTNAIAQAARAALGSPAPLNAMEIARANSEAVKQLDALAAVGGKRIAKHPDELQMQADAELPGPVGPDHWTRDDIEAALGCLEFIAGALETLLSAAQAAGALSAGATGPGN